MIGESGPPGPVGPDDEDTEDEEDQDVVDLVVPGSNNETGLGDEETDPNRDIHISEDRQVGQYKAEWSPAWSDINMPAQAQGKVTFAVSTRGP